MPVFELNGTEFRDLTQQLIREGHRVRFRASGESMHPFIYNDDILEVAPLTGKVVSLGDVLLVEINDGRLLAHRVVKTSNRNGNSFLLKGDACSSPDGWFDFEDVLGRVEVVERGDQRINLSSDKEKWRARGWIAFSPWVERFSWLPRWLKNFLRDRLLVH